MNMIILLRFVLYDVMSVHVEKWWQNSSAKSLKIFWFFVYKTKRVKHTLIMKNKIEETESIFYIQMSLIVNVWEYVLQTYAYTFNIVSIAINYVFSQLS